MEPCLLILILVVADLVNTTWWKKQLKNDWNPVKWVLIWEYSARAIRCTPTWIGLDGFQKSSHPCALGESSLRIGRVNGPYSQLFRKALLVDQLWLVSEVVIQPFQWMLRLLSFKAQGGKVVWKPSKPCHVGIHWIAWFGYSPLDTQCA